MEIIKRMNYSHFAFYTRFYKRNICKMSTKPKVVPELDHKVNKSLEECEFKPRKHPGRMKLETSKLPVDIVKTIQEIIKDLPVKNFVDEGQVLTNYLYDRQYPQEEQDIKETESKIRQEVRSKYDIDISKLSDDQQKHFGQVISGQVKTILKQRVYNWKKLEFNDYSCLVYLFSRAAPHFAVLRRIFYELSVRHPDFKPKTLLDFGSGVGTVSWVAKSTWENSINEFYCIDSSSAMNDLASLILRKGKANTCLPPNVFYRQFLPSQHRPYNLVVSAFSLFEFPSSKSRLETLLSLWEKTEDYLIIVEQGTKAGFQLVLEARDFLLSLKDKSGNSTGHVFAPCPHDLSCPRFSSSTPQCNFMVSYFVLPLGQRDYVKQELFSYVILKKGSRSAEDPNWPRIVQPVLRRSRHAICRMCTNSGTIQEVIFSLAKSGKIPYRCAKSSEWGDLLPVRLKTSTDNDTSSEE